MVTLYSYETTTNAGLSPWALCYSAKVRNVIQRQLSSHLVTLNRVSITIHTALLKYHSNGALQELGKTSGLRLQHLKVLTIFSRKIKIFSLLKMQVKSL